MSTELTVHPPYRDDPDPRTLCHQAEAAATILAAVLTNPDLERHSAQDDTLVDALTWLELEFTCGSCATGECHWGGEYTVPAMQAHHAGRVYVHPELGTCQCTRHGSTLRAWRWAERIREALYGPDGPFDEESCRPCEGTD